MSLDALAFLGADSHLVFPTAMAAAMAIPVLHDRQMTQG
jgi:hypothetical protein